MSEFHYCPQQFHLLLILNNLGKILCASVSPSNLADLKNHHHVDAIIKETTLDHGKITLTKLRR